MAEEQTALGQLYGSLMRAVPESARQTAAGYLTYPLQIGQFGTQLANPARAVRALTGNQLPDDNDGTLGTIDRFLGARNQEVNQALRIEDPSPQDDTGQYLLRTLGGAVPVPGGVIGKAVANAPMLVRGLARLAEVMTPLTVTNRTGAARLAPVAANTLIPAAAGVAVDRANEKVNPHEETYTYDQDGNLETIRYPVEGSSPGLGRVAANNVIGTVGEHPALAAAGAAGVGLAGLLAHRALRGPAAARVELDTSTINRPIGTPTPVVEPLRTNPLRQAGLDTQTLLQDSKAPIREVVNQSAGPRGTDVARDVNAMLDVSNDPAILSKVAAFRSTGVIESGTGQSFRTFIPDRIAEEHAAISERDPALGKKISETLTLGDERNMRTWHQNEYKKLRGRMSIDQIARETPHIHAEDDPSRPKMIQDPNGQSIQEIVNGVPQFEKTYMFSRNKLWHMSNQEIVSQYRRNMRDPRVALVAGKYESMHKSFLRAMADDGLIGNTEAARMGYRHPDYVHTTNLGYDKSPTTERPIGHKQGPEYGGDPWQAARDYSASVISAMNINRTNRAVGRLLIAGERTGRTKGIIGKIADPAELRRLSLVTNSPGRRSTPLTKADIKVEKNVQRFREGADLVEYEVLHPVVARAMEAMPRHAQNMIGALKGIAESGMTGKGAALTGRFFSTRQFMMNTELAMINRPKGMTLGLLDKGMQSATGGRVGFRGDPTAVVGMLATAGKNVGLVVSKAVGDSLRDSWHRGGIAKQFPGMDRLAYRLGKVWADSAYVQQMRAGAGDVNTLGAEGVDQSRHSRLIAGQEHSDAIRITDPTSMTQFQRWRDTARTATPASVKIGWRLLGEIQNAIGSAPQAYAFSSNVKRRTHGLTVEAAFREREALAAEVRNLTGDPAKKGSAQERFQMRSATPAEKGIGWAYEATPYAGISTQALYRVAKSAKDNPGGFIAAVAMTAAPAALVPLSLAYLYDRMLAEQGQDPQYVPWYFNRAAYQIGREIPVFIWGEPPENAPTLTGDPVMSVVTASAAHAVGWYMGSMTDPANQPGSDMDLSIGALAQYALGKTGNVLMTSIINASPVAQWPPFIIAGFAAAGVELPASIADSVGRGGASVLPGRSLSGYEGGSTRDAFMSTRLEKFMEALFPGLATTLGAWAGAATRSEAKEPGTGVSAGLREAVGRAKDYQPWARGTLWELPAARAVRDDAAAQTNSYEKSFRSIVENFRAVRAPDTTGSGRFARPDEEGGVSGVKDAEMRQLLAMVNQSWSRIERGLGERNALREQRLALRNRTNLDYVERRREENRLAQEISTFNRRVLGRYVFLDEKLSEHFGRRIRIDHINPAEGINQFPRIN